MQKEDGSYVTILDCKNAADELTDASHFITLEAQEALARRFGLIPFFITLTLPPRFHSASVTHTTEQHDPSLTPHDQMLFFSQAWRRIFARFAKRGWIPLGAWNPEPHSDGTPHRHAVLFLTMEQYELLKACLDDEFPQPEGKTDVSYKIDRINESEVGNTVAYIRGYMQKHCKSSKNRKITTEDIGDEEHNTDEALARVNAWKSTYRARGNNFTGFIKGFKGILKKYMKLYNWHLDNLDAKKKNKKPKFDVPYNTQTVRVFELLRLAKEARSARHEVWEQIHASKDEEERKELKSKSTEFRRQEQDYLADIFMYLGLVAEQQNEIKHKALTEVKLNSFDETIKKDIGLRCGTIVVEKVAVENAIKVTRKYKLKDGSEKVKTYTRTAYRKVKTFIEGWRVQTKQSWEIVDIKSEEEAMDFFRYGNFKNDDDHNDISLLVSFRDRRPSPEKNKTAEIIEDPELEDETTEIDESVYTEDWRDWHEADKFYKHYHECSLQWAQN